jgi:hypothetical protein
MNKLVSLALLGAATAGLAGCGGTRNLQSVKSTDIAVHPRNVVAV